jgi:transposase-like protein
MSKNTAVNAVNPEENIIASPLDEIVRKGALKMLAQALEIEVDLFIEKYQYILNDKGNRLVVRNGYNPSRKIVTGAGQLEIETPRVDDRILDKHNEPRFKSSIIPPYLRRTTNINELIPVLYLKGISTGDFTEALSAILGKDVIGLSPENIVRLKRIWEEEYAVWSKRDLSNEYYVYAWVDGVYFNVRLDDDRQCILIMIGAKEDGTKEPIVIQDGFRESKESWQSILRDLKSRGLKIGPKLAIGDRSLGFWAALAEEYPETDRQLCWVHKTANILDKLPDSVQGRAKSMIHDIYLAPSKKDANIAFERFVQEFCLKYPKATECLTKDRDDLLAFYDYPAEHWPHIRTTNPIESTFSTVRLRTHKTRGCGSRIATLTMVFKLLLSARNTWKKLRGYKKIIDVMNGVKFKDGVEVKEESLAAVAS